MIAKTQAAEDAYEAARAAYNAVAWSGLPALPATNDPRLASLARPYWWIPWERALEAKEIVSGVVESVAREEFAQAARAEENHQAAYNALREVAPADLWDPVERAGALFSAKAESGIWRVEMNPHETEEGTGPDPSKHLHKAVVALAAVAPKEYSALQRAVSEVERAGLALEQSAPGPYTALMALTKAEQAAMEFGTAFSELRDATSDGPGAESEFRAVGE